MKLIIKTIWFCHRNQDDSFLERKDAVINNHAKLVSVSFFHPQNSCKPKAEIYRNNIVAAVYKTPCLRCTLQGQVLPKAFKVGRMTFLFLFHL